MTSEIILVNLKNHQSYIIDNIKNLLLFNNRKITVITDKEFFHEFKCVEGKIKLVDMRLNEAIFEKEDKSFVIIDFNNVIREADEY